MSEPIKVRANFCPTCLANLNAVFLAPGQGGQTKPPKPGDFTLCTYCGQMLRFTKDLVVRFCTPDDLNLLPTGQRTNYVRASKYITNHRLSP